MNSEYTNPARAFPCPLVARDVSEGQQYLSLRSSSTPARFIMPVEVVKAVLLEPEMLNSGWKRRLLLAVPFQQEESLLLANIGKALNVSTLVLSIWSEALQFGTSLESVNGMPSALLVSDCTSTELTFETLAISSRVDNHVRSKHRLRSTPMLRCGSRRLPRVSSSTLGNFTL